MEIKDYNSPQAKVIEVKSHQVLCQSNGNTENFTLGSNSYDEDDWE